MTISAVELNKLKHAPPVEGVLPVVLNRWSVRSYADREVSLAELAKVFEAARWTASACNEQPWRFIVGLRNSLTYKKIFDTLMEFNRPWAVTAPVLILGVVTTKYTVVPTDSPLYGAKNPWNLYDLGAAFTTMMLQATSQGLSARTVASFDRDAARRAFAIPEDTAIGMVLAMGYPGEPSALGDQQLIAMETAPRTRRPLSELVFSSWGEPIKLA
jgi:nitroreductase